MINDVLSKLSSAQALERLQQAGIGTASVNTMEDLWNHPQLKARERWYDVSSPMGVMPVLKPICGQGWEPKMEAIPELGSHTIEILTEIGLSENEILDLTSNEDGK